MGPGVRRDDDEMEWLLQYVHIQYVQDARLTKQEC
jgi:hypothetical protein